MSRSNDKQLSHMTSLIPADCGPLSCAKTFDCIAPCLYKSARISEQADNSLLLAASKKIYEGMIAVALNECPMLPDLVSHIYFHNSTPATPLTQPHPALAMHTEILAHIYPLLVPKVLNIKRGTQ